MLTVLTATTPVPTHARGALRAFIRGQAGFFAWCNAHDVPSHNVKNHHLILFAIERGLENEVLAILNQSTLTGAMTVAHDAFDVDLGDFTVEPVTDNAARDAEMETMIAAGASIPVLDAAHILAPVEPFLSPLVRNELEKALQPLIDAANRPPVVKVVEKTIEKIVEREVNVTPLPTGATPYAVKGKQIEIGKLFGFKGQYAKQLVSLWEAHGAAPRMENFAFFVVDPFLMTALGTGMEIGNNIWLFGPSGTGKSTMPEAFCAYTGRPCTTFSFSKQLEEANLIGGPEVLPDGSTAWVDGALIQAVKRPGMVIVLDELSGAPAGVQMVLQRLTSDARAYTLPTGEVVRCAPGVVFVVADNTNGSGDQTGIYHGTNPCNAALVNRFKRMLQVDYMSKSDEAKAVVNHTNCPRPAADSLADFVSRARKLPEMEGMVLSIRQMTGFVQAVQQGFTPKLAAQMTFLNPMPMTERAALETLFTLTWASDFAALMSGTAQDANAPHGASMGTTDTPAGHAFDDDVSASHSY